MNLCDDGHNEVCFEGMRCPVCDMRDDLQGQIDALIEEIKDLKYANAELKSEIADLEWEGKI